MNLRSKSRRLHTGDRLIFSRFPAPPADSSLSTLYETLFVALLLAITFLI